MTQVHGLEAMSPAARLLVWAVRLWAPARRAGQPLPAKLCDGVRALGEPKLADMLDLTCCLIEDQLGRPLAVGCCCDLRTTADERALIATVCHAATGGALSPQASPLVPHGLPGVLGWSAAQLAAMLTTLGLPLDPAEPASHSAPRCPYPHLRDEALDDAHGPAGIGRASRRAVAIMH